MGKVFGVFVRDRVLGDELAEIHEGERRAGRRAGTLRETFDDVGVEELTVNEHSSRDNVPARENPGR